MAQHAAGCRRPDLARLFAAPVRGGLARDRAGAWPGRLGAPVGGRLARHGARARNGARAGSGAWDVARAERRAGRDARPASGNDVPAARGLAPGG